MTIEQTVLAFRTGDHCEDTFPEIYRRYYPCVRSFFGRSGLPAEDCRDLTQETFLRAWRGIEKFRGESKFRSWLYAIAANVGRSEFSKRAALKRDGETVSLDETADFELHGESDSVSRRVAEPLKELLTKEEAFVLRRRIENLPPRMRRILLLRLDQGLKLREIAVLEQISINTVKSQLAQARARLRTHLKSDLGPGAAIGSEEAIP